MDFFFFNFIVKSFLLVSVKVDEYDDGIVVSNESTDSDKWVFAVFANTVLRPPNT